MRPILWLVLAVVGGTSVPALAGNCPQPQDASVQALTRKGRQLFHDGKVRDALCTLDQATRKDATVAEAWFWLASAAAEVGLSQRAEQAVQRALELEPGLGEAWVLSGYIAQQNGNLDQARSRYQRYLQDHPGTDQAEELRWVLAQLPRSS
ncbi:MAG: tetratricopeptide repeat protein [Myxococcota bacterium]|nr:tetratricopeptide repeat protein [Myxococcota bacterium]